MVGRLQGGGSAGGMESSTLPSPTVYIWPVTYGDSEW
jgi:hypothetical protein